MIRIVSFMNAFWLTLFFSCQPELAAPTKKCSYAVTQETLSHPREKVYQELISRYVKKGLPGIILLIRDAEGTWVGSSGMADIDKAIPMQPCHISKAASITKMFVAVVALQLVEEGLLQLDEKANQWFDAEVVENIANADQVTLRQLLNHTTGIYDIIDDDAFYLSILNDPSQQRTLKELAEFVYGKDPLFSPGQKAAYSNTNTLLVSMIIEKITGRPHEQIIRERIFKRLNLQNTHYLDFQRLPANTAQGYFDLYNDQTIVNLTNYNTASGYGGMYSSVFDLKVFIEALLIHRTLLSQNSLDQMLQFNEEIENGKFLGAGIFKDFVELDENKYAFGHRGRDLAYTADLFWFPNQNTTMVMMLNYGTDAQTELRDVFYSFRRELGEIVTTP
ncbi:MAG: serine hydrolase [Cyclobacteriaceae bacterium]